MLAERATAACLSCEREQRVDGEQLGIACQRDGHGRRRRDAHTGKRAGPGGIQDGIDTFRLNCGLSAKPIDHPEQVLVVRAPKGPCILDNRTSNCQCYRTGSSAGFNG